MTKEPLKPEDLIKLNYSRKTTGEYHDPISFKPFSEHSHIVAIATTGNVYLAESIKGGKDLLDDVKFKKYVHEYVLRGSLLTSFISERMSLPYRTHMECHRHLFRQRQRKLRLNRLTISR